LQKLQAIQCRRFAVILFLFCDKFSGYPVKLFFIKFFKKKQKTKKQKLAAKYGVLVGFFFSSKRSTLA
jgi:hypothetical protein